MVVTCELRGRDQGPVTNANIAGGAAGSAVGWDDADGSHIFQFGHDFCN